MKTRVTILVALTAGLLAASAQARDARLPAKKRALLLLKALTFDRNIGKQRDALRIGIVVRKGDDGSVDVGKQMLKRLQRLAHMKVKGLKIAPVLLAVSDAGSLAKKLKDKRINLIYLGPGVDFMMSSVCKLAREQKSLVVSGEVRHARRCAAITAVLRGTTPKLLVNKRASSDQGASFKGRLLELAEVVN